MLDLEFGLWIGIWCGLGTVVGLKIFNFISKKYERQSPIVIALATVLGIASICVPYFGYEELKEMYDRG